MQTTSTVAFFAAALLAIGAATAPKALAQNVLIGNATANDTQAAANDKFAELIDEIFQRHA